MGHRVIYQANSINFNKPIHGIVSIPDDVFFEEDEEKRESEILQIIESELVKAEMKIISIDGILE